jgi:hypothetical protein
LEASIVRHISNAVLLSAVLGALVGVSCGDQPKDQLGVATSALELPIVDCQTAQATCLFGAKSPQDALQCNNTFGKCLLDAGPKLAGINLAVADCQVKAQQCVLAGGVSAVASCRTKFQSCVDGAGNDSDAGVATPTQPGTGGLPGLPGLPGTRPTFPGFPRAGVGGTLPGFPAGGMPSGAPGASCFSALNACVRGGTPAATCATQARMCLAGQGAAGAAAPTAGAGGAPAEFPTP